MRSTLALKNEKNSLFTFYFLLFVRWWLAGAGNVVVLFRRRPEMMRKLKIHDFNHTNHTHRHIHTKNRLVFANIKHARTTI
uniref:Putative secreted peptide n=1 Tax=Anopheles braziliensis TaxID=58242 RepID=A0A2M3ZPR2_9DIPT